MISVLNARRLATCVALLMGLAQAASASDVLFVAENASGKISAITVHGDKASVTVLKEGLNTPTGLEPAGDTLWITERGAGKILSIPMPQ